MAIRAMVRAAPRGSVVVLSALDHAAWFEGPSPVTSDSGDPIALLSIDDGLDYLLERRGCRFVSLRQLLEPGAYDSIDRLAEQMGGQWNLVDGQDLTEFEGVSYAALVEWEMTNLFARVMKSVVDAQAVSGAGLGDTFLIPVRPGLDAMIPFSRRDIMGDQPESLFAAALDITRACGQYVRRMVLPGAQARRPDGSRWRIRLSQAVQRWIVRALLPWVPGHRLYAQDEHYLGPELIRALAANERYRLVRETPAGLRHSLRALRGESPLHIPPAWFGRRAAGRSRRRAAVHFSEGGWRRLASAQSNGALCFRDVNLGPLLGGKLQFLFQRRFPELAAEQAQIRAWLKATRIRASVLTEEVMQWSRQVIVASRPLGMASLCIQHAVMGHRDFGIRRGFLPVAADVTGVWGQISRTWMERAGVPRQQLVVVGSPRFDRYPQTGRPPVSAKQRETFCARAGISPTDRLILYAETPALPYLFPNIDYTFRDTRTNLEVLLTAMRELPGFRLGIRLRQGFDDPYASLYQDLIHRHALDDVCFLQDFPLDEVLLYTEFTIVAYSNVGIEALYYDQPVIVVDLTGYHRVTQIVDYGAGVLANSPGEFVDFVRRYDVDPDLRSALRRGRERLLRDQVTWRDGGASGRVIQVLDSLVDRGAAATRAAIAANTLRFDSGGPSPAPKPRARVPEGFQYEFRRSREGRS